MEKMSRLFISVTGDDKSDTPDPIWGRCVFFPLHEGIECIMKIEEYVNGGMDMEVRQLIGDDHLFEKLYDLLRMVDPISKEVLDSAVFNGDATLRERVGAQKYCYQFWGDEAVCENCCSTRASRDKQVYMKTEYDGEEVYMVTSLPMEVDGRDLILEAVVGISDKELLNELTGKDYFEIKKILKARNLEMVKDPLTQAYNRRFIDERLPYEMFEATKNGTPMVLAMADIDHFKKVNDTYGHDAGDAVLKDFVALLNEQVREHGDWVARYGGEEFVVFLKGISQEKAYEKLDEIRRRIEAFDFVYEGKTIPVTCSFGMSAFKSEETAQEWLKRSDGMLYRSKASGRNQVTGDACA